ncbi:MAG TPA: NAD-dependent epimerase/dehydratase family protein [Candidatus Baltobacteraceae bacterium]|nr:NAD-dependent epimerase/dehydratase family protein [Candidatus Baltobacteraceae bacterium]
MAAGSRDLVFLTGASGFVGAHVLRALIGAGYEVRALARAPLAVEGECETVRGDLSEPGAVARSLEGCRYLVHTAAHYSFAPSDRERIYRVNVAGTEGLFAAAHIAGVERAVLTSSSATLGHESEPNALRAASYHRSKVLQERAAFAGRVPTVAVLPTAPVGPGDWKPTPTGRMIVDFMRGRMIARPPASGGMNVVDVEQVAQAHVAALQRGTAGERYVVGGEDLSFDALWDLLAQLTGRSAPRWRAPVALMFAAGWFDEVRCRLTRAEPFVPLEGVRLSRTRMYADSSAAQQALGVSLRPVRDALARAVAWYREHGYAA